VTWCGWLGMPQSYAFSRRVPLLGSVSRLCRRGGRHDGQDNRRAGGDDRGVDGGDGDAKRCRVAPDSVVVLHVTNAAHVSAADLAEGEQVATRVYAHVAVRVVWTDGAAATAQPDAPFMRMCCSCPKRW
jgi:hypothetical protein